MSFPPWQLASSKPARPEDKRECQQDGHNLVSAVVFPSLSQYSSHLEQVTKSSPYGRHGYQEAEITGSYLGGSTEGTQVLQGHAMDLRSEPMTGDLSSPLFSHLSILDGAVGHAWEIGTHSLGGRRAESEGRKAPIHLPKFT